ncbi:protein transport protein Sec24A-like [Protopterus annectens]|uniref:protein transport protein Sec24A-like n=1 Tax=Protopterus annectens TaxID=7888 RepID=UPI001CF98A78|nr:protein transport protein Sec24A-like [Protopterus annectens]
MDGPTTEAPLYMDEPITETLFCMDGPTTEAPLHMDGPTSEARIRMDGPTTEAPFYMDGPIAEAPFTWMVLPLILGNYRAISLIINHLQSNGKLPSNDQTLIGFITFDSSVHFYNFQGNSCEPQMIVSLSTEDIIIPVEDNLLVNVRQRKEDIASFLTLLPTKFKESKKRYCAFGAALQAAQKVIGFTGGRVSMFLSQLPNKGCGTLYNREQEANSTGALGWKELAPAEFYKTLATTFAAQDTTVDLFLLSREYCDLASLSCIPRTTCGSIYFYPGFHHIQDVGQVEKLQKEFQHYLTRPIGTKALLRICSTEGLILPSPCRSSQLPCSDLLHIPVISPDTVFTVQMEVKEKLVEWPFVTFQSCLLYTSGTGQCYSVTVVAASEKKRLAQ